MSPEEQKALDLLYQALGEPHGLLVHVNDFNRARQRLYSVRRSAADPALSLLTIKPSPWPEGNLVICRIIQQAKPNEPSASLGKSVPLLADLGL